MRILVVSDTHGDEGALQRAVQAQPSARTVIHLGDGAREAEAVAARFPDRMFWQVRGNGDFALGSADLLYAREETLGGKRLFFTHGHLYGPDAPPPIRSGSFLLCGHTHLPVRRAIDGFTYLNPGSLALPKEGTPHSCLVLENGIFTWRDVVSGAAFEPLS